MIWQVLFYDSLNDLFSLKYRDSISLYNQWNSSINTQHDQKIDKWKSDLLWMKKTERVCYIISPFIYFGWIKYIE